MAALNRRALALLAAGHIRAAGPTAPPELARLLTSRTAARGDVHDAVSWALHRGLLARHGQLLDTPPCPAPDARNGNGNGNARATPAIAPLVTSALPPWKPTRVHRAAGAIEPAPPPTTAATAEAQPHAGWSDLQRALLDERDRDPDATEHDRIATVASRFGLTPCDVRVVLERAPRRLPKPGRAAPLAPPPGPPPPYKTARCREVYAGARRGGHSHHNAIRVAARHTGLTEASASAVLAATTRDEEG